MTTTTITIKTTFKNLFYLSIPKTISNTYPDLYPSYLSLWDALINQNYTEAQIQQEKEEVGEDDVWESLTQNLIYNNQINLIHPLTGQVLAEIIITGQ